MNIPTSIIAMLAGIFLTIVSLWYGQNNNLMPVAASDEASQVDGLFTMMLTISTGLFLLVQAIIVIAAVKFHRRPDDKTDGPPIHGNVPLEILWTALPAIIVLGIGVYSFEVYNQMGGLDPMASMDHGAMQAHARGGAAIAAPLPGSEGEMPQAPRIAMGIGASPESEGKPADVNVNVTGLQYAWVFNYADTGIVSGELHLPLGKEAQLNIAAQDVLHAFWLPQFRLKQDAIPGRTTELRFKPTKIGTYPIVCAELCGGYHGSMKTQLIVETPEAYNAWVEANKVASNPDLQQAVAVNAASLSEGEYLAPYLAEMGVDSDSISAAKAITLQHLKMPHS